MDESAAQYGRDGFFLWPDRVLDDALLARAQAGLAAVRDERYDTGVPPSSHPGYDPQKLCKINDAHLASEGLYDLLVKSNLGSHLAAVTGSQRIQVWGHVDSRAEYVEVLQSSHLALVTAHHDFFGISVLEAALAGVHVIAPNELAYPEHFMGDCLHERSGLAGAFIRALGQLPQEGVKLRSAYSWPHIADAMLASVVA